MTDRRPRPLPAGTRCSSRWTLGAVFALPLALASCASPAADATSSLRQPAEFEPQDAIWMSPVPDDPEFLAIAIAMADALLPHVRLEMQLPDDPSLAQTRDALRSAGLDADAMHFSVDPLATLFLRDGAVFLVDDAGALSVLDLAWSRYGVPGWCERLYADDPDALAECLTFVDDGRDDLDRSIARACDADVIACPLFLENAAFEVNGRGVLLICEALALERNSGRPRDEMNASCSTSPG